MCNVWGVCHDWSHPHYRKESIYLHKDTNTNDRVCAEGTSNKWLNISTTVNCHSHQGFSQFNQTKNNAIQIFQKKKCLPSTYFHFLRTIPVKTTVFTCRSSYRIPRIAQQDTSKSLPENCFGTSPEKSAYNAFILIINIVGDIFDEWKIKVNGLHIRRKAVGNKCSGA